MVQHHPERLIPVDGAEICSDAFGRPDDPALLLIMGLGSSMLIWEEHLCRRLASEGRFVIRFDNRDTGRSTAYPPGRPTYSLHDMALDAVSVLDHHEVDRAHVVGASMGGWISQLLALDHRDRVASLALVMTNMGRLEDFRTHPPSPAVLASAAEAATLDWGDEEAVHRHRVNNFRVLAGSAYAFNDTKWAALMRAEMERASNYPSLNNHIQAVGASTPWHRRVGEIDVPTIVAHGTDDPTIRFATGRALADAIPGAEFHAWEGVGHEVPDELLDEVLPILVRHTAR